MAEESNMLTKWTTTKPTKPGWYWWRQDLGGGEVLIVREVKRDPTNQRLFMRTGLEEDDLWVETLGGEWQGPLEPKE